MRPVRSQGCATSSCARASLKNWPPTSTGSTAGRRQPSVEQVQRQAERLRDRLPPAGAQAVLAQRRPRPGVAAEERRKRPLRLEELVEIAIGSVGYHDRGVRTPDEGAFDEGEEPLELRVCQAELAH